MLKLFKIYILWSENVQHSSSPIKIIINEETGFENTIDDFMRNSGR